VNKNLEILALACKQMGLSCRVPHPNEGVLLVDKEGIEYPFVNWSTPLNSHAHSFLCQDKDYFYRTFKEQVNMPSTKAYLVPQPDKRFSDLVEFSDIASIVRDIKSYFDLPVIIKPNRGSWGLNVSKACSAQEVQESLDVIFDANSKHHDYCALAQQYIEIATEIRSVFVAGELQFAYAKSTDDATPTGNLSPLHWEGSRALDLNDQNVLADIQQFCQPLFSKVRFGFLGLDVAIDTQGNYWLIEANAAPGFDFYIRDCGVSKVRNLYLKILDRLGNF
jgi:glutathione synthase/RimK-type ligase-like ATP-grasp enzyme